MLRKPSEQSTHRRSKGILHGLPPKAGFVFGFMSGIVVAIVVSMIFTIS